MGTQDLVGATSQLQSLLDDVNDFIYDRSMPTVSAGEYVSSTADGGEAIQAAVDALPARGGRVVVPQEGPDDGIAAFEGSTLDNVWEVTSTIDSGTKSGVWITGQAPGWITEKSGTTLVATASFGPMIQLSSGFLDGVMNLQINANQQTATGVQLGDGTDNDFKVVNCAIHQATADGVNINCDDNVWLLHNWIEGITGGNAVTVTNFNRWLWIDNQLFNGNEQDLFVNSATDGIWLTSSRSFNAKGNSHSTIEIGTNANRIAIRDVILDDTGDAAILVQSDATVSDMLVDDLKVYGGTNTNHVINNQGAVVDSRFNNLYYEGVSLAPFVNLVNDPTNTTRITMDGLGYNGANDPASAGDWNGNGEEGVRVLWDNGGTPTLAEYVNGTWYSRAL